jgi:hypothetical protein
VEKYLPFCLQIVDRRGNVQDVRILALQIVKSGFLARFQKYQTLLQQTQPARCIHYRQNTHEKKTKLITANLHEQRQTQLGA